MGNRAVITTPEKKIGLYMHWNGGRDTVEPLLRYCELKGYRPPSEDCYGWARLSQVIGNFFGGALSVGVDTYEDICEAGDDNGVYVIEGWKIVDRIYPYDGFTEQADYDFEEMLRAFDAAMPVADQLGEVLDAVEVPLSDICIGDEAWLRGIETWENHPVIGFGVPNGNRDGITRPYVGRYDHNGDYSWNPNNYLSGDTVLIKARKTIDK